jgi:hypothetical protein
VATCTPFKFILEAAAVTVLHNAIRVAIPGALAVGSLLLSTVLPANAQAGCSVTSLTDPPREVLRCRGGLTIEAEEATRYRLIDGRIGEPPKGAEVSARGILIDLQPGRRRGFQVLTPHAIASVRGTIYAVDVQGGQTSVFVARGRVAVGNQGASRTVLLTAGEGVDVVPGRPLEVKAWGRERAANLLAPFGR